MLVNQNLNLDLSIMQRDIVQSARKCRTLSPASDDIRLPKDYPLATELNNTETCAKYFVHITVSTASLI